MEEAQRTKKPKQDTTNLAQAQQEAAAKNKFAQLCLDKRVNFYRVLKTPGDFQFKVVPFDDFAEHSDAAFNCILFETERISYLETQ
jgi:hypothetical protein